ncbi:LPXTG cell wall anchor domain-containing protein [Actinokineospora enzanensis]|uniref:LPXTG cell wall anchor domain-containing protein n=1 Tax=Actinokineospora enzanensis TaxID=155975 RepID=UPI00036A893E|nr:LPXTG cell wall anchor domain-containing protein [Actinokineospora enzanensis]
MNTKRSRDWLLAAGRTLVVSTVAIVATAVFSGIASAEDDPDPCAPTGEGTVRIAGEDPGCTTTTTTTTTTTKTEPSETTTTKPTEPSAPESTVTRTPTQPVRSAGAVVTPTAKVPNPQGRANAAVQNDAAGGDELANTGADVGAPLALGSLLVVGGASVLVLARRRRSAD